MAHASDPSVFSDWLATAERMVVHPDFPCALARLRDGLIAIYASDWARTRVLASHRHYGVGALILYFDAGHVIGDGPPCCRAAIIALASRAGIGTRRGVRGIIATMVHLGFVAEERCLADRRAIRLRPLPPLAHLFEEALDARLAAARILAPDHVPPALATRQALAPWLAQLIEPMLATAAQPRHMFPEVAPFAGRLSGYLIMFALIAADEGGAGAPPLVVRVSDLARSLHVSRMQIIKVLCAAENNGLLRRMQGGAIVWESSVHDRLRQFAALELARAVAAVAPGPRRPDDRLHHRGRARADRPPS